MLFSISVARQNGCQTEESLSFGRHELTISSTAFFARQARRIG
jgi:hypothetical protein